MQHTPSEVFHYTDARGPSDAILLSKSCSILQAAKKDLLGLMQLQVSPPRPLTSDLCALTGGFVVCVGPWAAGGPCDPPPREGGVGGGSPGRPGKCDEQAPPPEAWPRPLRLGPAPSPSAPLASRR